jgi:xanthine dehydrogenase YagS FAD-binding subunit
MTSQAGTVSAARVCLNAVFVKPYRAIQAEEAIIEKAIDETTAEAAGIAALSDAKPLEHNRYMVHMGKTLVKRTIMACQ